MRRSLTGVLILIFALLASPVQSATPDFAEAPATLDVTAVEPATPRQWSYVSIAGTGLMRADGTCDVMIGGKTAYVSSCSPDQIVAIVPWQASGGTVVVTNEQGASDSYSVAVTPVAETLEPGTSSSQFQGIIEIRVAPGVDAYAVATRHGGDTAGVAPIPGIGDDYLEDWYRIAVPVGEEITKSIEYSSDADVLYAGPVGLPVTVDSPNDELYGQQWALSKINAPTAWSVSKGGAVRIAVIDTGFSTSHSDLASHILAGWNCNQGTNVGPLSSHGTWVSGVAAAVTNNGPGIGSGIAGVGWDSSILPLRYDRLNALGTCNTVEESYLLAKAIESGAKVVNMSYRYETWPREPVCARMRVAWIAGLTLVAAAGNNGSTNVLAPAACDKVIAVAASSPDDSRASYSNFGTWIDVSAPGGAGNGGLSCSSNPNDLVLTTSPTGYERVCGTSFAAPHVAGVAALLAARGFHNCAIVEMILNPNNVDPINWQGGVGRLNAGKALAWWGGAPIASVVYVPDGSLLSEESTGKVYVIYNKTRYYIPSPAVFAAMGFNWRNVQCVPDSFFSASGVGDISADKTLLKELNSAPHYVVHCGARFWVPDPPTLNMLIANGYANQPVYVVPDGAATALTTTPYDGCLLKEITAPDQYTTCAGMKWLVPNSYVLDRLQALREVLTLQVVWDGALSAFPSTLTLNTCSDEDGDRFSGIVESFVGTFPDLACSLTPVANDEFPDVWPVDNNDDQSVGLMDVMRYIPFFNTVAPGPPYDPRYDLNVDGRVGLPDVLTFIPYFNQTCAP